MINVEVSKSIPCDSVSCSLHLQTNTTQTLQGPTTKDPSATYFASTNALVQLSASSGSVSYLQYTPGNTAASASASWSVVSKLPSATTTVKGNVTSSSTSTATGASSTNGGSSGGKSSGSLSLGTSVTWGLGSALLSGVIAFLL